MTALRKWLPILSWLPGYRGGLLKADAVAALSVWALLVPQGLAYATIAGVPVQYGLYTAFAALIAYAIFGTSRQLVQGPSATVAAVSAAVIAPLAGAGAGHGQSGGVGRCLALASGAIYVALGVLKMGWVSNFLSKAVLAGFILGFAVGIVIDQSYKLLGVDGTDGTYVEELVGTLEQIPDTNVTTLLVGVASLAILLLRYLRPGGRARSSWWRWPPWRPSPSTSTARAWVTGEVPTGLFRWTSGVGWSETARSRPVPSR